MLQQHKEFQLKQKWSRVESLLTANKTDEAIAEIDQVSPTILANNPILRLKILSFKVRCLSTDDLSESHRLLSDSFSFIFQDEQRPEQRKSFFRKLEDLVGSFVMQGEHVYSHEEVLAELLDVINQFHGVRTTSKVEELKRISEKVFKSVKKIADVPSFSEDKPHSAVSQEVD